jgi:hypothetical protein
MKTSLREKAVSFLQLVASGKVREAYQMYIGPGFRHHNPFFRGDADSRKCRLNEVVQIVPKELLNDAI